MDVTGASILWSTLWAGGSIMGAISLLFNFVPEEYMALFYAWMRKTVQYFNPYVQFDIPQFSGAGINEIYDYVEAYLSSTTAIAAEKVSLCRPINATHNTYSLGNCENLEDKSFMNAKIWWTHVITPRISPSISWSDTPMDDLRRYVLRIPKKDKDRVLEPYLQHVIDTAKLVKERTRDRLLYTNLKGDMSWNMEKHWESVPFKHPSTFDTLAMDPDLKDEIKQDLVEFTKGKEFYERAGKPWKRGYLLYGPPGTGKSSMIAAIANFLKYDIYDVELTEVSSNSKLRKLLIHTSNRSVIVIEDIDCSVDLAARGKAKKETNEGEGKGKSDEEVVSKVTLSGLLNFTDGLWSCCGSERIIIFTTNYIEKLDPALLRVGRMDKRILMSWCQFPAFRTLAKNNLELEWHDLFPQIEEAFQGKAITPADVSEHLLNNKRNPTAALQDLLAALATAPLASEIKPPEKEPDNVAIVGADHPPATDNPSSGFESSTVKDAQHKDAVGDVKESKTEATADGSVVSTTQS